MIANCSDNFLRRMIDLPFEGIRGHIGWDYAKGTQISWVPSSTLPRKTWLLRLVILFEIYYTLYKIPPSMKKVD